MESRRTSDLSLPYGKIAMWGVALSVVVTGAFLALAPSSPARMAAQALDGRSPVSGALLPDVRHLPTAAEVGRRAVEEVLGGGHDGEHRWGHEDESTRDDRVPDWLRIAPRMRAEVRREWRKMAPELRDELRRELRRELRGLRVDVDATGWGAAVLSGVSVGGV